MTDTDLFSPYDLGGLVLANRIVMAPLTRNRAGAGLVPSPFAAEYYSQRASAGLIITEATQVSRQAQGYQDTPGLYTPEQIAAWRKVTDAVHAKGGRIFVQLWHVGRVSHVDLHGGEAPVAPSAIRAETKTFLNNGFADVSEPRALGAEEIPGIGEDFRKAAANAIEAGFDGVEVHGANGYLLDQFLRETANVRTDAYGGSVENRARLLVEVTAAVASEIGAQRTGVRLSPVSPAGGIVPSGDEQPQFNHVVEALDGLGIAYIHVVEGATGGPRNATPFDFDALRQRFRKTYIANNGYDLELAMSRLSEGKADLFAFGHHFIANPDLVERLKSGKPLAQMNPATIYGGGAEGYTDYPAVSG
ncbi:alkene reductase (plasmid) [Agrobacterium radiobacter]|uniref:N-ethylmaleimide reductase n=1 Tax=Agrobacterium tumefaciens str. B6 TaxID=1183423 RepID=A0A822VBZ1_AGRTU|nr:alkene reductase [Agrobacterium tumefaciens]MQB27476.1 alkene reductase [Agrobacterium tumefaciens]NTA06023.1 alkene reductase [Agrobacterium tumefaciens]NTA95020.1 alkene reductase [Agrobacterium tumefaciens]NTB13669.1 alkene reductase [Agrobacterium tumefaciens]OCJ39565.1 alkene reductase [Agrobacterium tumefaciens]